MTLQWQRTITLLALGLAGCRAFIPDKIESVPEKRLDTSVGRALDPALIDHVSLKRQSISVELRQEHRCQLVHRDQVKTTTTYKLEPTNRATVITALAGTVIGGALLISAAGCGGGWCEIDAGPKKVIGSVLFIPGVTVLTGQMLPAGSSSDVKTEVVTSEEPGSCGQAPLAGVSFELVFPSGFKLAGRTDDAGKSSLPLSDEAVSELRQAEGRMLLRAEGQPLRRVNLSAELSVLPPLPSPPRELRRREPRRNQDQGDTTEGPW